MSFRWEIRRNRAGEYVAFFLYNQESIWWTEGYSSKAAARNAIKSIKKNAPGSEIRDETTESAEDDLQIFKEAIVPASDRIVSPDHNSREFREFEQSHERLADRLRRANDLPEFSSEELELARNEVERLGEEAARPTFRAEYLWNVGKSTLLWIAEKAIDGIIKALAVGTLIALATLLGIHIPIG